MATMVPWNAPSYIADSSEIDENDKIPGVSYIGAKVFMTDLSEWYIVLEDLSVVTMTATP